MSDFLSRLRKETTTERLARFRLREDTLAAAQSMVSDRRSDPQIVALEQSLTADETVLRMADGRHSRQRGLVVLTDHRILFRSKGRPGQVVFSVPITDIASIEGSTRRSTGTIVISAADGQFVVDEILGLQGEWIATRARQVIAGDPGEPTRDPLELLGELRELRAKGAITQAEFETRKSALWGDL